MSPIYRNSSLYRVAAACFFFLCVVILSLGSAAGAQISSSSSSSNGTQTVKSAPTPPTYSSPLAHRGVDPNGSAITLETSEPLFDLGVALNACGYDDDLEHSDPVRREVRADVESAVAASPDAQAARTDLCAYVRRHTLADPGLNVAQYISLALYLKPPPELTPTVDETDLPADSTQVVNILPLLRTFADTIELHALWVKHRPEYEALVALVHEPLTRVILNTDIYLKIPVSSADGRRFLVLLEPLLAPVVTNARIYGADFIVVASPAAQPKGSVHMDLIRHTYLHFEIEPLVYSRASAMERFQPLLRTVQNAPLEFTYKSDIVALITECMIKAVEAHTMDIPLPLPARPDPTNQHIDRVDQQRFDAEMLIYERQSEAIRRNTVDLDMRHGWILTQYFYDRFEQMQRDGSSLKDDMGEIVYGMDVDRERQKDSHIAFLPDVQQDFLRHAPRQLTGLDLGESKLMKGDRDGAASAANQALADTSPGHDEERARAHYLLARVDLLNRKPEDAVTEFQAALDISKDPRTLAWCHIYLGRLYDMEEIPDRKRAVAEYRAALNLRDDQPDTRAAAESGLKAPFSIPRADNTPAKDNSMPDDDNTPLDPTGKAEKQAYKPPPPPPQP